LAISAALFDQPSDFEPPEYTRLTGGRFDTEHKPKTLNSESFAHATLLKVLTSITTANTSIATAKPRTKMLFVLHNSLIFTFFPPLQ